MHIPAMVLIEAARQMFLAVTETYYIDSSVTPYRFLINTIQCQFHLPVFPLPITVRYEVLRHDEKKVQHQFDVAMAIVQADRLCVTFRVVFTAVELRVAKKQERIAALTRLRGYPAAGLDDT
jgi:acyl-CoA thioesterase FadM